MKFNINSKDFKALTEKAVTCINKKAPLPDLTRIYLEIDTNGILNVKASNMDHYLTVLESNVFNVGAGNCAIDNEDLKVINKLSGMLTVKKEENKLIFDNGNKKISIPCHDNYEIDFPKLKERKNVLTASESWMLETLTKLDCFMPHTDKDMRLECFNFNTKYNRVEALDGHRIGMRSLDGCQVGSEEEVRYTLHNSCMPAFKKVLDKKSNNEITFDTDGKYNEIKGNNFVYISRCYKEEWLRTQKMLDVNCDYNCIVNRAELMEVAKYNKGLAGNDKKPMILYCRNGILYSYIHTARYESLDIIKAENLNIKEDFTIGFNSAFIFEGLNIMEKEEVMIKFTNPKAPAFISCEDYNYLLLPVNLNAADGYNVVVERINKLIA